MRSPRSEKKRERISPCQFTWNRTHYCKYAKLLGENAQINNIMSTALSESLLSNQDGFEFRMGAMTPGIDIALAKHALVDATTSTYVSGSS